MAKSNIYYIRKNETDKLPANILILDTETHGDKIGKIELQFMHMAWTWRMHLDSNQIITKESWRYWENSDELGYYIEGEARDKATLYVVGSNITFDIWAAGLHDYFTMADWRAEFLYDKGLVTIIPLRKGNRRIKFLALQNFVKGSVYQWGKMLNLPKLDVDFNETSKGDMITYCHRDVEITGEMFLSYLRFITTHDMGGFAPTISGQCMRAYRHRFMEDKILHYDQQEVNQFVRAAYYGGRTECRKFGRYSGNNWIKLDINSQYPSVMRNRWYPTKLAQWVRDPVLSYATKKAKDKCVIAECVVSTTEPCFPVRLNNKLCFPIGTFTTFLCTPSFNYAMERGLIQKVKQLLVYEKAKLFTSYVDYFYPLKVQYKKEGETVWAEIVKLAMNSLYGKFGAYRDKELIKCPDPDKGFYRRAVIIDLKETDQTPDRYEWTYESVDEVTEDLTVGIEWAAFGTYCMTAGKEEDPQNCPPIAAHVTDYGRMLLWSYIEKVGWRNIWYCDTDSLIIEEKHLPKLQKDISDEKLGALKIEGEATELELLGNKYYRFGNERKTKGIRANAVPLEGNTFTQTLFPSLPSLLRTGISTGYPIGISTRTANPFYDKGTIGKDGFIEPFTLEETI